MLGDTSQDRTKLVDTYLAKSKALVAGVNDTTTDAAAGEGVHDALQYAKKALDVDPTERAAQGLVTAVKDASSPRSSPRVTAAIQKLVAASKFTDARTQVPALNDLNRRTGNSFDADVRLPAYSLNFSWAKALYAQKDYATAEVRVDAALAV